MTGEKDEARERLRPYVEKAHTLTGWDFSQIRTRRLSDHPWDYWGRIRQLLRTAESIIDIGTGGGERFSEVVDGFFGRVVATESWLPNIPVAAARLRPLGVGVVCCDDEILPFAGETFDLIVNRHSGWDSGEVARVLKPGGVYLTQQVDTKSWKELRPYFPGRQFDWGYTFATQVDGLRLAGLGIVESRQSECLVAHRELGDLLMNLIKTPWEIQNFDPLGADLEALLALEEARITADGLVLTEARALIEARKPG